MNRLAITPAASSVHDGITADLRTITSALAGGFTTPGAVLQACAAITRLQENLPALRRELRSIRSGIRRVA